MRRKLVSLTLSITALLAFGLAASGQDLADEARLAGNGWGNGEPVIAN